MSTQATKTSWSQCHKRLLCLILVAVLILPLVGCSSHEDYYEKGGEYFYTSTNEKVTNVTLDVIALAHYKEVFSSCNERDRRDVLSRYLQHHVNLSDIRKENMTADMTEERIDTAAEMICNYGIDWNSDALGVLKSSVSDCSSVLPLVELYANVKDFGADNALQDYVETFSKVTDIAGTVFDIAHTTSLIMEMSTKDISNPEEYCAQVISVFQSLVNYIPIFGEAYAETIGVVGDGLQILIKKTQENEKTLLAYEEELNGKSTIFSKLSDAITWELIAHPSNWTENSLKQFDAPTLEDIYRHSYEFPNMSNIELQLIKEYMIKRLSFGLDTGYWHGFALKPVGESNTNYYDCTRFKLDILQRDQSTIRGTLTVSYRGMQLSRADFEAKREGKTVSKRTEYSVTFASEINTGIAKITTTTITYDEKTNCYILNDFGNATLQHCDAASTNIYAANETYKHLSKYTLQISQLSAAQVNGTLIVTDDNGNVEFSSAFHGQGWKHEENGKVCIYYEAFLENPIYSEKLSETGTEKEISEEAIVLRYYPDENIYETYFQICTGKYTYRNELLDGKIIWKAESPETTVPETTIPETTVPETTIPETTAPEAFIGKTGSWYGYGTTSTSSRDDIRFDLEVTSIDESQIQGILTRSKLYNIAHQTAFTGTGKKTDNQIEYTIRFETPTVLGTIPAYEHKEIVMVYDIPNNSFWMDDFYSVTMVHGSKRNDVPLIEDETWSGYGRDIIEYSHFDDHLFVLHVDRMSEAEIYGTLTVYHKDAVDHAFEFSGRGYLGGDGHYHYEIRLDASRANEKDAQYHNKAFLLNYNCSKRIFDMGEPSKVLMYSKN